MSYLTEAPQDTDAAQNGAQAMRAIQTALNKLIAMLWTDGGQIVTANAPATGVATGVGIGLPGSAVQAATLPASALVGKSITPAQIQDGLLTTTQLAAAADIAVTQLANQSAGSMITFSPTPQTVPPGTSGQILMVQPNGLPAFQAQVKGIPQFTTPQPLVTPITTSNNGYVSPWTTIGGLHTAYGVPLGASAVILQSTMTGYAGACYVNFRMGTGPGGPTPSGLNAAVYSAFNVQGSGNSESGGTFQGIYPVYNSGSDLSFDWYYGITNITNNNAINIGPVSLIGWIT